MAETRGTRKIGTTIFLVRKVRLSRAHFVEALELDGSAQRLGPFEARVHAEYWIRTKAARWVADRLAAPGLPFADSNDSSLLTSAQSD